ncbi:MAG: PAS domain S-box protein [Desulfobacterales bacterium]|nr:MAG: PAS domain S-box protein [Desulfobacterales bacterium]
MKHEFSEHDTCIELIWRHLLKNLVIFLYDENGNIVRWNKNHQILTGFSADEISHRKILDWFDEEEKKYIDSKVFQNQSYFL